MAVDWTREMDAALLIGRGRTPPVGWKRLAVLIGLGVTADEAKRRHKVLTGGSPEAETTLADRDGLAWLLSKKRLTADRHRQAMRYREAFRNGAGVSIKSSAGLWGGAGGGAPGSRDGHDNALTGSLAASRDLHVMRWAVIRGQADMIIVLDGVCGIGHTLRDLAGGDWARAAQLEMALKVALDLLHADQYGVEDRAPKVA